MNNSSSSNSWDAEAAQRRSSDGILRDDVIRDDVTEATVSAELDEAGASLPNAEEVRGRRTSRAGSSRRSLRDNNNHNGVADEENNTTRVSLKWVWAGAVLSFLLLVVVLPVLAVKQSQRNNNGGSSVTLDDSNLGRGPDSGAASRPRPQLAEVVQFLLDNGISSAEDLDTENSPQQLAAAWLAEEDPANLPVPTGAATGVDASIDSYRYMARYVLALDYFAWEGENWKDDMNFLTGDDICFWNQVYLLPQGRLDLGVFCEWFQQRPLPRYLHFNGVGLKGSIPTENGLLSALYSFEVQGNEEVTGSIPQELCNLENAYFLGLGANSLTGQIPSCLGDMNNLFSLVLYGNMLDGAIPSELGLLSNSLHELYLDDNMLTGPLPDELGNLENLDIFFFYENPGLSGNPIPVLNQLTSLVLIMGNNCDFSGDIDDTFLTNLPNVTGIDLSHNEFMSPSGLPAHLFAKPYMQVLDLSVNQLQGQLPTDIPLDQPAGPNKLYFNFLSLYENQLEGPLPTQLANLVGLDHLDLSMNAFTGPIPDFIGDYKDMQYLFLSANSFDQGLIPDTFEKLTKLEELSLRGTARTGSLPTYIGTNLTKLVLLDLSSNALEGDIPGSYGSLEALEFLLLNNNEDITGTIPSTFTGLTQLQGFFLDGTSIMGDLDTVCVLPKFAEISGQEGIFADCAGGPITCSCDCTCYDGTNGGEGSQANLANLDASWENRFRRSNLLTKFVLLDGAEYIDPDTVSPTP